MRPVIYDKLKNILILIVSSLVCVYLAEYLMGFYLTKSLLHHPIPPHAEQTHTTVDYNVSYRYNNFSLRGDDYDPDRTYDMVLLGDSFFFGQGVREEMTLYGLLKKDGFSVLNLSEIATQPIDYYYKIGMLAGHHLKARNVLIGLCMGNDFQGIGDKRIDYALQHHYGSRPLVYDFRSFLALERLQYQLSNKWVKLKDTIGRIQSKQSEETVTAPDFEHHRNFQRDWIRFFAADKPEVVKVMQGFNQPPVSIERLTSADYLQKIQMNNESLNKTVRIIDAIYDAAKPARVYLVLIPGAHYALGFRSEEYRVFVKRLCGNIDKSIQVIDLHGMTTGDMHFLHDGHWNEKGHRSVAEIIVRHLPASP